MTIKITIYNIFFLMLVKVLYKLGIKADLVVSVFITRTLDTNGNIKYIALNNTYEIYIIGDDVKETKTVFYNIIAEFTEDYLKGKLPWIIKRKTI